MISLHLRSGCAALALIAATPALAQAPGTDELAELVRAQAAEIASLKARIDRLEGQGVQVAAAPPVAQQQPVQPPMVVAPFAPQIVPPGPADIDVAQARAVAANPAGVKTEWGAGLPVFRSADGVFTYKPRGRILVDVSSTTGSDYAGRNTTTTGMRALRLGLEGGVGPHFFYQFESDFSENEVDIASAICSTIAGSRPVRGRIPRRSWSGARYRRRSSRSVAFTASARWAGCSARTGTHRSA